ncbi:hypothetical protein SAMN05443633_101334 [Chryseobacterium arachidis]|uniref:Uncharacterized protein n=1 Tax=Chryseobacterium arachidis TaxID=1416778 RepID=A0A1M4TV97_9FLAO|nr:hypothetical protein SAMN05443633_101334 [Chryseobacterium arachidis]
MSSSKNNFLDLIAAEIKEFYGIIIPVYTQEQKIVYTLSESFSGLFQKKLYVYFLSGKAIDYRERYFIFGFTF